MKKILTVLLNTIVLLGFAGPTDTIPTLMPPRPPQNYKYAPHIQYSGNQASFDVHFLHDGVTSYEKEDLHVYPNPVKDMLNTSLTDVQNVEIYDLLGKINSFGCLP